MHTPRKQAGLFGVGIVYGGFVDAEDAHAVHLWELGDEQDGEDRGIDGEVDLVVVGVVGAQDKTAMQQATAEVTGGGCKWSGSRKALPR